MLSVGIIGASGYTGLELVKIAIKHPHIAYLKLYGNQSAGMNYSDIYPELTNCNLIIESLENISFELDVYFLALPHTKSISIVKKLMNTNRLIIDLSADFRLNSSERYAEVYGTKHILDGLLKTKVYGLPEFVTKTEFKEANLIANPGCFPTVTLLSLLPLKCIEKHIINVSTSAYSGTSGAGKKERVELSFTELFGNSKAYSVLSHRHQPEIEQQLENSYPYVITMHLLPVNRGIYATHTVFLEEEIDEEIVTRLFYDEYKDSNFVRLRSQPPELKWVIGTNYCDISVKVKGKTIVITSCIDNLIKGASGQAIQNMNLKYGFKETEGLI